MLLDSFSAAEGNVFSQSVTPLGTAIPIYTATDLTGVICIFNPPKSGVDVEILEVTLGYGSGTSDYGSIGMMCRALDSIATGQPMTALAATAPKNGRFNKGRSSSVQSSNAGTNTVTAGVAGDWWRTMFSVNLEAQTGTAHGVNLASFRPVSRSMLVPPGNLVYLAATKATTALYASTIVWAEWNSTSWG
jgi:hypothetical protein